MNDKDNYNKHYFGLLEGQVANPRGLATRFRTNVEVGFYPGCMPRRPNDNPAIGFIEMLQIFAGNFDHKSFEVVAPNARLDLFTPQMAYGPRISGQIEGVIEELRKDPDSRRAEIIIARHDDPPADRPCTIAAQFQLPQFPGGKLRGLTTTWFMRSSDAVWGLPYDIIQFGGVAMAISNILRVPTTRSAILIGNAHVYENTKLPPEQFWDERWEYDLPLYRSWSEYREWAQNVILAYPTRANVLDLFAVRKAKIGYGLSKQTALEL